MTHLRLLSAARVGPVAVPLIVAALTLVSQGCREGAEEAPPAPPPAQAPPAEAATTEAAPASTTVRCEADGTAGDPAPHGLALTWDSSLHCLGAPERGTLAFTVALDNRDHRALTITGLRLIRATPGPLMKFTSPQRGRDAFIALEATGLPLAVPPGGQATLTGTGRYLLDRDEAGVSNANLHATLEARVEGDGITVDLPLNLHVRRASTPDAPRPDRRKGPPR